MLDIMNNFSNDAGNKIHKKQLHFYTPTMNHEREVKKTILLTKAAKRIKED